MYIDDLVNQIELKIMKNVKEFTLVWFESTQEWISVLDNKTIISDDFGAVGYALSATLNMLDRGEAEFLVESSSSSTISYVYDDEFYVL